MDSTWFDGIISYASVAVQLHLPERAEELFALLAAYHDQVPCQGVTSREPIAMYLGGFATVLGQYDDAERYFTEATSSTPVAGCSTPRRKPTSGGHGCSWRGTTPVTPRGRTCCSAVRERPRAVADKLVEERVTALRHPR